MGRGEPAKQFRGWRPPVSIRRPMRSWPFVRRPRHLPRGSSAPFSGRIFDAFRASLRGMPAWLNVKELDKIAEPFTGLGSCASVVATFDAASMRAPEVRDPESAVTRPVRSGS